MFAKFLVAIGVILMIVSTGTADSVPHSTVLAIAGSGLFTMWLGNKFHVMTEGKPLFSFNPKI